MQAEPAMCAHIHIDIIGMFLRSIQYSWKEPQQISRHVIEINVAIAVVINAAMLKL